MKRKYEFEEETLECPLCNEVLSPPIHQCQNGHMGCRACCEKLKGKECPTCRAMPFAHSRNLGLESIVESLRTTCVHAPDGCTEMLKLAEKDKHAKEACDYRQLKCPLRTCNHKGFKRGIPDHFKSVHDGETVQFPPGMRSGEFTLKSWNQEPQYVLFTADAELFLVLFQRGFARDFLEKEYEHSVNMFSCSSFGNESLKYILKVTGKSKERKSKEGVFSASAEALALNNQNSTGKYWDKKKVIFLPHLSRTAEIVLQILGMDNFEGTYLS